MTIMPDKKTFSLKSENLECAWQQSFELSSSHPARPVLKSDIVLQQIFLFFLNLLLIYFY